MNDWLRQMGVEVKDPDPFGAPISLVREAPWERDTVSQPEDHDEWHIA